MRFSTIMVCGTLGLAILGVGAALQTKRGSALGNTTTVTALNFEEKAPSRDAMTDKDRANIARLTAQILAQSHYLKQPLDDEASARLMDRFLESFDPLHMYLLQSDMKEFEGWRTTLDEMILERGDTSPANKMFARFIERFDANYEYVQELLKSETFDFTGEDEFVIDRKNLPRPGTLEEAKKLWRDRLRYEYLQEKLNKQKPEEIVKTITRRYSRLHRALHEYDADDVFEIYLTSMAHAYDPHSDYMGKSALETFNISMKLSLFGIGALLTSEDGYAKIAELTPGGPAIRSNKLKAGDRIVKVAQGDGEWVDTMDMKLDKVVEMVRGAKGTKVRLTVIPVDATDPSIRKEIVLVRDEVKLEESEAKSRIIDMPGANGKTTRMGVIDLPSFYADMDNDDKSHKSTTTDVARLIKKLKAEKVEGIILDLRRNGGGSLTEAIKLTGLFIKSGPVVQVRDSDGSVRVDDDPDPGIAYDGPMIVLTSKGSASASEILTGALQDYGRALIVGDSSTFGKGTVQAVINLDQIMKRYGQKTTTNPGALKLTIQKFYRASGSSTQLKGVTPDIVLPSINNVADIGEKKLETPMPWDTIPSAKYDKMNKVQPYLGELRKRAEGRLATDKDFAYIREDIERYKQMMAKKTISLNEAKRLKEKQENEARAKARKQEILARPLLKETIYAITLKDVDKAGLPAPLKPEDLKKKPNAAAKSPDDVDDTEKDPTEAALPPRDITLEEARRILSDLISLSPKTPVKGAVAQKR